MRVLITNNRLDYRGGAESFVGDLARGLQGLGHTVMAYSSDPGRKPRLLEQDAIPVATDLDKLQCLPDIIHAQHHLDAMTALATLPGVPALYHCHGAVWRETQPSHPRIYRYLAVSRTLKERMMAESGLAEGDIEVVPNSVDLDRFKDQRQPPPEPLRALFYNGHHRPDSPTVAAILAAADRLGLPLDFHGKHFGSWTARPEDLLRDYDLVFASGRSAIDALASGCAVIMLGRGSCGKLVRMENFDHCRDANFAVAANAAAPCSESIEAEIRRIDPADTAMVARRLRQEADSRLMVARMVGIYGEIISRHKASKPDLAMESIAMGRYLRHLVPLVKILDDRQRQNGMPLSKVQMFTDLQSQLAWFHRQMSDTP